MELIHITLDIALEIQRHQIDRFGGGHGIRDQGLLESALAQPQATFGGEPLHKTLPEMAAAYLYHVVTNHPFIDGNKRTGALCAFVFLRYNGNRLTASEEQFEQMVMDVASGQMSKPEVTKLFELYTKTIGSNR